MPPVIPLGPPFAGGRRRVLYIFSETAGGPGTTEAIAWHSGKLLYGPSRDPPANSSEHKDHTVTCGHIAEALDPDNVVLRKMAGPCSFLAGTVLASLADSLARGPTPPWLVRVGACLGCHFPTRNLRLRRGRPGLLL